VDSGELDGWDDWLVIAVDVCAAEGRGWSFSAPCLTTEEARDVYRWLRRRGAEAAALAPRRGRDARLRFIEPNLEFRLLGIRIATAAAGVRLLV
jgi:hypothetical protein